MYVHMSTEQNEDHFCESYISHAFDLNAAGPFWDLLESMEDVEDVGEHIQVANHPQLQWLLMLVEQNSAISFTGRRCCNKAYKTHSHTHKTTGRTAVLS